MKKIVCLISVIILAFSFASCEKSSTLSENRSTDNVNIVETGGNTSKTTAETIKFYTYKVPMKDIYIDAPNYQEIEQAYTELFIVHESK